MRKKILLHLFILVSLSGIAQNQKDTVICEGIPVISTRSTIEGFPFNTIPLHISNEFFKKNFKLISSDSNWEIDGFWYYYDCENCDIYAKAVKGNKVDVSKHIIFSKLKKGEVLDFTCINIERNGKRYITQNFIVIID